MQTKDLNALIDWQASDEGRSFVCLVNVCAEAKALRSLMHTREGARTIRLHRNDIIEAVELFNDVLYATRPAMEAAE